MGSLDLLKKLWRDSVGLCATVIPGSCVFFGQLEIFDLHGRVLFYMLRWLYSSKSCIYYSGQCCTVVCFYHLEFWVTFFPLWIMLLCSSFCGQTCCCFGSEVLGYCFSDEPFLPLFLLLKKIFRKVGVFFVFFISVPFLSWKINCLPNVFIFWLKCSGLSGINPEMSKSIGVLICIYICPLQVSFLDIIFIWLLQPEGPLYL